MPRCRLTAPLLVSFFVISLFVCPAVAQLRTGNLKVRITFTNGHPCSIRVMVQLMLSAGSTSVAENYTHDEGQDLLP